MEAVRRRAILPLWALILLSVVFFLLVPALIHGVDTPSALLSKKIILLSQHVMADEGLGIVYPRSERNLQGSGVASDNVVQVRPSEGGVDHGHTGTSGRSHSWRS